LASGELEQAKAYASTEWASQTSSIGIVRQTAQQERAAAGFNNGRSWMGWMQKSRVGAPAHRDEQDTRMKWKARRRTSSQRQRALLSGCLVRFDTVLREDEEGGWSGLGAMQRRPKVKAQGSQ